MAFIRTSVGYNPTSMPLDNQQRTFSLQTLQGYDLGGLNDILYVQLAASPLAFGGFTAIVCYRASPYDGIYIIKNYTKLNKENPVFRKKKSDPESIFLPKTFP